MTALQSIQLLLGQRNPLTTSQIARTIGQSVGHVGRVLVWMDQNGFAQLIPGSYPYLWTL
jgi:hypothetical protein